jgi:hypothetical protein
MPSAREMDFPAFDLQMSVLRTVYVQVNNCSGKLMRGSNFSYRAADVKSQRSSPGIHFATTRATTSYSCPSVTSHR